MNDVAIIDCGGANIASLLHALERLDVEAKLTTDAETIQTAGRVVLPGVGAAKDAMQRLHESDLTGVIRGLTQPVLGICLGMQLLADASEEEDVDCLGIIPGIAAKLARAPSLPVPNMGWCPIAISAAHPLLKGIPDGSYFYFVHSYALPLTESTIASAQHSAPFSAVVARGNFVATQFHPERSSKSGAQLLRNFLALPA